MSDRFIGCNDKCKYVCAYSISFCCNSIEHAFDVIVVRNNVIITIDIVVLNCA